MKYNVGDIVFYKGYCEGEYKSGKITARLIKSNRYKVEVEDEWIRVMDESELFISAADCIDSEIAQLENNKEHLISKIALLRQNKQKELAQ